MTGLKSIIEAHWAELTSNQQRVGAFVLSNPFLVATMGIEDLAEAAGVSPPTITRFVRQLGLKNYAEFRAIAVRRYQDLLRPIENVSRAQDASSADVVGSSLAAARAMARLIGRMGPRDLIIAMTLPRYSVATMEFVRLARASGVPTVGITDSAQSPLAALCDDTVLMPAAHPVLNSSALASLAFFEAVAALLTARYQSTSDATAVTRLIFPYLYTDEASSGTAPKDQE